MFAAMHGLTLDFACQNVQLNALTNCSADGRLGNCAAYLGQWQYLPCLSPNTTYFFLASAGTPEATIPLAEAEAEAEAELSPQAEPEAGLSPEAEPETNAAGAPSRFGAVFPRTYQLAATPESVSYLVAFQGLSPGMLWTFLA